MPTHNQEDSSSDGHENSVQKVQTTAESRRIKKNKNTVVEIVSIPTIDNTELIEANKIASKANAIAKQVSIINTFMFVATFVLAGIAIFQYRSSQSAATIAQKTLDTTRKYDSISAANQKIAFDRSKIDAKKKTRLIV